MGHHDYTLVKCWTHGGIIWVFYHMEQTFLLDVAQIMNHVDYQKIVSLIALAQYRIIMNCLNICMGGGWIISHTAKCIQENSVGWYKNDPMHYASWWYLKTDNLQLLCSLLIKYICMIGVPNESHCINVDYWLQNMWCMLIYHFIMAEVLWPK